MIKVLFIDIIKVNKYLKLQVRFISYKIWNKKLQQITETKMILINSTI